MTLVSKETDNSRVQDYEKTKTSGIKPRSKLQQKSISNKIEVAGSSYRISYRMGSIMTVKLSTTRMTNINEPKIKI
jgi:hypothetical protein